MLLLKTFSTCLKPSRFIPCSDQIFVVNWFLLRRYGSEMFERAQMIFGWQSNISWLGAAPCQSYRRSMHGKQGLEVQFRTHAAAPCSYLLFNPLGVVLEWPKIGWRARTTHQWADGADCLSLATNFLCAISVTEIDDRNNFRRWKLMPGRCLPEDPLINQDSVGFLREFRQHQGL